MTFDETLQRFCEDDSALMCLELPREVKGFSQRQFARLTKGMLTNTHAGKISFNFCQLTPLSEMPEFCRCLAVNTGVHSVDFGIMVIGENSAYALLDCIAANPRLVDMKFNGQYMLRTTDSRIAAALRKNRLQAAEAALVGGRAER